MLGGLVLALAAGCAASRPPSPPGAAAPVGLVYALLDDNRLLAVRPADGTVVAVHALGPPPASTTLRYTHRYLALSPDGRTLYALVPGDPGGADRLVLLDPATADVRATYPIPNSGDIYLTLAIGPQTGRIYLFGTRGDDAVVAVVDQRGTVLARWTARRSDGPDWVVWQGAVSPDERRLFISYHGQRTTGIDRFSLTAAGLERCPDAQPPGRGCLPGHGGFLLWQGGLLAATGTPVILREDDQGTIAGGFDTRLVNNHLMAFAVDPRRDRLYAVGSCGYAGGYSVLDLRPGPTPGAPDGSGGFRWSGTPAPPVALLPPNPPGTPVARQTALCGEGLTVVPGGGVAVAKLPQPVPQLGVPGAILLLDAASGRVRRTVPTASEPLDVLAVP